MGVPFRRSVEGRSYPHIRKLYYTPRWKEIRRRQLQSEPNCRMCAKAGKTVRAAVCDHVDPHRGDEAKFWAGPFQSLCETHHSVAKQIEETRGYSTEVGVDGWPVDAHHPANRR
ncbi:MAG: HNH endonuclease [Ancalomicrobiaceae bacterium]|nr:HNH endonuclease [Ancalomicrobiaceae bacterium]